MPPQRRESNNTGIVNCFYWRTINSSITQTSTTVPVRKRAQVLVVLLCDYSCTHRRVYYRNRWRRRLAATARQHRLTATTSACHHFPQRFYASRALGNCALPPINLATRDINLCRQHRATQYTPPARQHLIARHASIGVFELVFMPPH